MSDVTDELVERACRVFADNDWLYDGWDSDKPSVCPTCGSGSGNGYGDGGKTVRAEVRELLTEILAAGDE